ncbi:MAG: argininosuccinate lyase, partial [Methanoregulaceae archaeon]|nr:argininosuccinate lyase [Methanoregulaceae archaeon]
AKDHTATIMPGFTHMQHAQPTTLAHHLLGYEQAFSRDSWRLSDAYNRVNLCPLGAAAFAGTGYRIDREWTAKMLGFDGMLENTMDAVASRDFALEVLADCAVLMTTVSRLCEELVLWSSRFVRFAELDDAHASTSSIMPQKKNPDTAEIMRAHAGTVSGDLVAALTIVKGLPMSYNRDLQELTPPLWEAVATTNNCMEILAGILKGVRFDTGRMAKEAKEGGTTATDLADMLVVRFGLPFRTAHTIVAAAVREGTPTPETLDRVAATLGCGSLTSRGLTGELIREALDPERSVTLRDLPGGPAPAATGRAIDSCTQAIREERSLLSGRHKRVEEFRKELLALARELAP